MILKHTVCETETSMASKISKTDLKKGFDCIYVQSLNYLSGE